MTDCTCNPQYLRAAAERALSPSFAAAEIDDLFRIAPNPLEHGRANQAAMWLRAWSSHANRLIWC
jgi:hypothetical protein